MAFRTQDPHHPNVYGARIVIAHQNENTNVKPLKSLGGNPILVCEMMELLEWTKQVLQLRNTDVVNLKFYADF
ncbi:MAG: hypothetical protein LBC12_03480 [Nitrososphaerota archaeon]|jgi:hypothetical protein|nr:hypothetical protein [Nitrososphaerota archaeon]